MTDGIIYKIMNNLNDKIYIGQTIQSLEKRMTQHKIDNLYVDKAIRKHGWENFTVEILAECESKEKLDAKEIFYIAEFNCKAPNGYNLTDGGE